TKTGCKGKTCKLNKPTGASMSKPSIQELETVSSNIKSLAESAMEANDGLLRLAPTWVPRSFLQPAKRLKLDPSDRK
ncbi:MAG: hypothetical protein VCG02_19990, partial [Verrucomicrobiota bacterium]